MTGRLNKKLALEYLTHGMKLRTLVEGCKSMVAFMHSMDIGRPEEIRGFEETLGKFDDKMTIEMGPRLIEEIRRYVGDITDFQTEIFGTIHKCTDVATFLMSIWSEFDTQTQFVTGQHGSDFETELINALRHVKTSLAFVERGVMASRAGRPESIMSFCNDAKTLIPTAVTEKERLASNLVSVYDHLTMIRVWYMSITSTSVDADNLVPFLTDILQNGQFEGKLSRQDESTLCLVKKRDGKNVSEYGPKFVQEFVRGLKVFLGKKRRGEAALSASTSGELSKTTASEEKKATTETLLAEKFVELTERANEAFREVEKLRDMGHPKYQVELLSLGEVLSQGVVQKEGESNTEWQLRILEHGLENMEGLRKKYHEDGEQWRMIVNRIITESEKRLIFLDNAQLLQFWRRILELKAQLENPRARMDSRRTAEIDKEIMHHIYPYLWISFPEYYGSLCSRLNILTLRKKLIDVVNNIHNERSDNTDPCTMIEAITAILQEAGKVATKDIKAHHTKEGGSDDDGDNNEDTEEEGETAKRITKYVLEKPWNTPNDVYMCLSHKIYGGRVHPSYLFRCKGRTTGERLRGFLRRVDMFPQLSFTLVGVNELGTRVKEELLRWVNERFERGKMRGRLHMIFTEEYGTELFNFVCTGEPDGEPGADDRWGQPVDMMARATAGREKEMWPNICNVRIYDGKPLSGKTELAWEDIKKCLGYHGERKTAVSVTEDFTAGDAGHRIEADLFKEESIFPDTALYFNVSPYAPLEEFGTFLYNLLAWGIIADQRSGEVLYVYTKLKLNMFIELGTAPPGDRECRFSDAGAVLAMLPLVRSFRPVFSHEKIRYKYSEDGKICAAVKTALDTKKLDYGTFCGKANPQASFVTSADHKNFVAFAEWLASKSPSLAVQGRLVKLLSERYMALLNYTQLVKAGKVHPLRKFFSFNELIVQAFDDEIKQYTRYPLGRIERFTYFPPDGSEPAVMDFSEGSHSEQPREDSEVRCLRFVSLEQVCQSLCELYTLIGGAFGVPVERCRSLLEGRGYVLTPDFAMKLMFLNTCRGSNQNVVFSGDTGTGKSELLEVFSQLINLGSPVIPRPLELLREALRDVVPSTGQQTGRYDLVGAIEDLCDNPTTFSVIRDKIAAFTHKYLETYKLVDPTPDMLQASEADAAENVSECLVRKEHVLQVVQDILRGRLRDVFHRIQMHQHIYPPEFRERVHAVAKSAELVMKDKVTIIGFIDECTSTSIMGMIKEVLIDNSLDGIKLPPNIMWIGAFNRNNEPSGFTLSSSVSLSKSLSASASSSSLSSPKTTTMMEEDNNNDGSCICEEEEGEEEKKKKKKKKNNGMLDFTGVDDGKEKRDFAVRPPPISFEMLEIQFSPMSGKQQRYFLRNLLKLRTDLSLRADHASGEFEEIEEAISFAHEFVREKNIPRVHPSIRDLVRCINLYAYFRRHHTAHNGEHSYFPADLSSSTVGTRVHVYSLVLAIAISYYFRVLPEYRAEFAQRYATKGLPLPSGSTTMTTTATATNNNSNNEDPILRTFKGAALQLYRNTAFLEGIAATDSFLENLFCTVVCIDAKVPLMVVGPPGCSKTLSFSIAMKNMRGRHSVSDFYKTLSCVHPLRYQCSRESVDTEIQAVYDNAITRQHSFDKAAEEGKASNIEHQRVVVLLDEAGLPDEEKAPLKILHYVLDHPQVSTIILSNSILDAAKTNRTALLIQMAPEKDDLYRLVQTCVYGDAANADAMGTDPAAKTTTTSGSSSSLATATGPVLRSDQAAAVRALAGAYRDVLERQGEEDDNSIAPVCEFFHLRDFVYLLRYLGRVESRRGDITSADTLVAALRRNFGGVCERRFKAIVGIFLDAMEREIPGYCRPTTAELEEVLNRNTITEALRESLSERIERLDDPNTAPYRYILLIDPSDSELAISLLFDMGLCERDKTDIVHIPDFSDGGSNSGGSGGDEDSSSGNGGDSSSGGGGDASGSEAAAAAWRKTKTREERAKEDAIIRMKDAMEDEDGKTVVLVNAMEISTSFYDVFNRHFDVLNTVGKDGETHYKYFANVAVGSLSQPCPVNPDFRAIVHLPMSAIRKTPAPFLNRFEKYYMSLETIYNGHLNKLYRTDPGLHSAVTGLKAGCEDMVAHFHGKSFFYGIVPDETVTSLVLPIAEALVNEDKTGGASVTLDATARVSALIPPVFHPNRTKPVSRTRKNKEGEGEEAEGEEKEKEEEETEAEAEAEKIPEQLEQVRRMNYHLFQLARPECVFSRPDIPDCYKREYLVSQEHFSVRRLIRGVFRAADGKPADSGSAKADHKKWCIFTRTCGELSRLHEQKRVRNLLLEWEGKNDPDVWSEVLALEAVATSDECNARIDKFLASPKKRVFVCTANMAKVSADQVNLVRSRIDTDFGCENEDSVRLAFVILHFPPEIQHLQNVSSSQAVFFNKWNFSYVDTLGVYANTEREGTIEGEEEEEEDVDMKEASNEDGDVDMDNDDDDAQRSSLDARNWLGYAYGIKEINQEKVLALFRTEIMKEGRALIARTNTGGVKVPKILLPNSKDAYGSFRTKFKTVFGDLVEKKGAEVFESFFRYIVEIWFRLVKDIVRSDCNAVMSGARSSGLLCHLDTSLKRIYVPAAKGLTEMICSNYTLEALLYAFKKGRTDASAGCPDKEIALMRAVIEAMPPFSIDDILRASLSSSSSSSSGHQSAAGLPGQRGVMYERSQSTPAYLPFFNAIYKRVRELAKAAKILAGKSKNSYEAAALGLERLIEESDIKGVVGMIFADPYLCTLYKRDFVIWGLGLPDLYVSRADLAENPQRAVWLDKCVQCIDSLTNGHADKLAYVHFVPDFFQRVVYRVSSAITPLLHLTPVPRSLELMDSITTFDDPNELTRAIVLSNIRILYKFLLGSGGSNDESEEEKAHKRGTALKLFAQTFKEIRTFAPRKSAVRFLVNSVSDLAMLSMEMIVYYFVLYATQAATLEAAKAYDKEDNTVFERLAPVVLKYAQTFNYSACDLYDGIAFAVSLSGEAGMDKAAASKFVADVALFYLEYDAGEREPMPGYILNDVSVLIENCQNVLPRMWTLQFLGRWLEPKPIEWGASVLAVLEKHKPRFTALDLMEPSLRNMDPKSFLYYHLLVPHIKRVLAAVKYDGTGDFKTGLARKKLELLSTPTQNIVLRAVRASLLLTTFVTEVLANTKNDEEACTAMNATGVANALTSIFRSTHTLVNADIYFFSAFQDEVFVQRVCRWDKFIHTIGLDYYYIELSKDAEGLFLPPYALSSSEPLFGPYHDLEKAVRETHKANNPKAFIEKAIMLSRGSNANQRNVKMMLITIFYYDFFCNNVPLAPAVGNALDSLATTLDIRPEEMVVLKFFTRGFYNIEDPRFDPLIAMFSVKGRADSDNMFSHLMANVIAFTLGCRRESTHMYERAFNIAALNDAYGPGSNYHRYNWDCGYRIAPNGSFEWGVTPPIMHENRAYRLALNSITWSAICWSQISNPESNYRAAISNHHFINCLDDERKSFNGRRRTDQEAVRSYLFARGTTFFYEFSSNQDYIDKVKKKILVI